MCPLLLHWFKLQGQSFKFQFSNLHQAFFLIYFFLLFLFLFYIVLFPDMRKSKNPNLLILLSFPAIHTWQLTALMDILNASSLPIRGKIQFTFFYLYYNKQFEEAFEIW